MNQEEVLVLDAVDPQGCGLRVEFFRVGPRWAHRVLAVEDQETRPLLESLEGDDQQPFPPSPALQQLDLQQVGNGLTVALLIGMAGKNHWSVGVEAFPDRGAIKFDVACRNQPCDAGALSSAYTTLTNWQLASSGAPTAVAGNFQYELVPQEVDGCPPTVECEGLPAEAATIRVLADRSARTQRWCYEFRQRRT